MLRMTSPPCPVLPRLFLVALASATALACATSARAQLVASGAAAWWSEARDGRALVVHQDGKLVFEQYTGGLTRSTGFPIASITKSFASVLAACAIRDGLLRSFDELVADTLTEWKSDGHKSKITYRHLLSMSSGLEPGVSFVVPSYAEAVKAAAIAAPGQRFDYGPNPYQAFGAALQRKLLSSQRSVTEYLNSALLAPIGILVSDWLGALQGEPQFPSGAVLAPSELMKFGDFLRNEGRVGDRQLLAKDLLRQCLEFSATNSAYRLGFYGTSPTSSGPVDLFWAAGAGGQRLYVLPDFGLTILRYALSFQDIDDAEFQDILFPAWTGHIGDGCRGSRGTPRLSAFGSTQPTLGASQYALTAQSCPEFTLGVYLLGASQRKDVGGADLPLDLTPFGLPGCTLFTSLDILVPFVTDATGRNDVPSPIPNILALAGKYVYVQALLTDSAANSAGLTLSDAILVRVGRP